MDMALLLTGHKSHFYYRCVPTFGLAGWQLCSDDGEAVREILVMEQERKPDTPEKTLEHIMTYVLQCHNCKQIPGSV
jgi:hypothetical protein